MIRSLSVALVLLYASGLALAGPKGTAPRSNASRYPTHVQVEGASLGARLLTPEQARKTFVSDVNRCCVVVEVGVYPTKDKAADLSLNDFVLRVKNAEIAAKPSSAKVVAASLQKRAQDQRDVTVSPTVGVGYGSGTAYDPVYGPRSGGVYTSAGVGVGIGSRSDQPGSTDKDRAVMETELSEKGLPEGSTVAPIAGYMYFPIHRDRKAVYQLEYMLNGQKVLLTLN